MKISKEERARRDGFDYFVSLYQRYGVEAGKRIPEIDEEIERRALTGKPIGVDRQMEKEFANRVQYNCLDTIMVMSMFVLHDKFGFGTKRLERFQDEFTEAGDALVKDYISWGDIRKVLQDETGIETKIRWNGNPIKDEETVI